MCFSEGASFTAAAVLGAMGAACLIQAKKRPERYLLALIPLLFGVQQAAEGVEWLHFKGILESPFLASAGKYLFLFFALIFWPFWIPFSVFVAERETKRKWALLPLVLLGAFVAFYTGSSLFANEPIAEVYERSIQYTAHLGDWIVWPYAVAGILPLFVTSIPRAKWLGFGFLVTFIAAGWAYFYTFTSVWCFACALMSVFVYAMVTSEER